MKQYIEIVDIFGREVMDSRGNPTVEVEVHTECASGRAIVSVGCVNRLFLRLWNLGIMTKSVTAVKV